MTFVTLGVHPEIARALSEKEIISPTMIQEQAIPLIAAGRDVIGVSKTGSGKTAAFGVPLLAKVTPGQGLQALILAPTRELAVQISRELRAFGKYLGHRILPIYGGVSLTPQMEDIPKADIIVGTPGRILDHLSRRTLSLTGISCLILDEADKMVEMGFIEDIERIISQTPESRQMLLFGATLSGEIDYLVERYMHDPATVEAERQVQADLLQQYYYNVEQHEKFSLLVHLLKKEQIGQAIVFCSARSTVELVAHNLRNQGIRAEMIHGKLSQSKRLQVMDGFKRGNASILVASSVAARGLDLREVTHVFNYDLARDSQEYIHRIGRTARAGESGKAITLLSSHDHEVFRDILRRYDVTIEALPLEEFPRLRFEVRRQQHGFRGDSRNGFRNGFRQRPRYARHNY
ncbi:DEAD/DEAH box helicase [Candidatus Woesearchaeota archaeon]|nr:DEAD/DEAH box helicase [Candidatus Woesearchaeota archaeon]